MRLCQRVNYGSILNLRVVDGDVCFESPPEIIVEVKLDGDITQRHELDLTDFVLPVESCRLLGACPRICRARRLAAMPENWWRGWRRGTIHIREDDLGGQFDVSVQEAILRQI